MRGLRAASSAGRFWFAVVLAAACAPLPWALGDDIDSSSPPGPTAPPIASATTPGTAPAPSPAAQLDPEFLSLPAYDLDRVDGTAQLKVGDSVILRLQGSIAGVTDPNKELRLEVPAGTESLTDQGWELDSESATPGAAGEFRFKATPLKPGRISLPSLAIVKGGDPAVAGSGMRVARTNPFSVETESAIKSDDPKPEQPADLRPPVSLRFPWWLLAAGALLLGLLAGAGAYAYLRWRARKLKPAPVVPAAPPRPEDEVALAALAELERNGPLKRGEFKAHYFRVSEILKVYVGARYGFDAAESTTREMITQLEEKRALSDQQIDRLETLFEKLDLVKFTDHVPLPDEGMRLAGIARDFVLSTRRPPEILSTSNVSGKVAGQIAGAPVRPSAGSAATGGAK